MSPHEDQTDALSEQARGLAPGRARLRGRRVLVVGAGSQKGPESHPFPGNGRAIAILCAREDAAVACADIDADAAAQTARTIAAEGGRACVLQADISDPWRCETLIGEAAAELGGLDGLVLNVGIFRGVTLRRTEVTDWDLSFAINVRAHALLCRHALARLAPGSSIVFTGSIAALGTPTQPTMSPAYDATKAALMGLNRHVAIEGARLGIRANLIAPGLVDTPMLRATTRKGPVVDQVPLGRSGTAWEVAYAAIYLLSGESAYVTGQTLAVDGGLTMR